MNPFARQLLLDGRPMVEVGRKRADGVALTSEYREYLRSLPPPVPPCRVSIEEFERDMRKPKKK